MEDDCGSVWRLFGVLWAVQYTVCSLNRTQAVEFWIGFVIFPPQRGACQIEHYFKGGGKKVEIM